MKKKQKKSLKAEDLEKRAAPLAIPGYTDPGDTPYPGSGTEVSDPASADQPGASDGHRSKLWKKT